MILPLNIRKINKERAEEVQDGAGFLINEPGAPTGLAPRQH